MGRIKGGTNRISNDTAEAFAMRVEQQIKKANVKSMESLERLACRLLTNPKTPQVQAAVLMKWAEWRFGPLKQKVQIEGQIEHKITLEEVRARIIELDRKRRAGIPEIAGDGSEADRNKQAIDLLPSNGTTG